MVNGDIRRIKLGEKKPSVDQYDAMINNKRKLREILLLVELSQRTLTISNSDNNIEISRVLIKNMSHRL